MLLALFGWVVGWLRGTINTSLEIPAIVTDFDTDVGPVWPYLFIYLASGTISGWHNFVGTHFTSHLLEKETQTLPLISKAVFGETILVTFVIMLASAFGVTSGLFDPNLGFRLVSGPGSVLAFGIGNIFEAIGISSERASSVSVIFFVIILLPVMMIALRIIKDISREIFGTRYSLFKNHHLTTISIIIVILILIASGVSEQLWVLFAEINLLIVGIALVLITNWLFINKKKTVWIPIAGIFIFLTSIAGLAYTTFGNTIYKNMVLGSIEEFGILTGNIITAMCGVFCIMIGSFIFFQGLSKYLVQIKKPSGKEPTLS
jgi:carbon starvation protein